MQLLCHNSSAVCQVCVCVLQQGAPSRVLGCSPASPPFFLAPAEQSEVVAATLSSAGGELLQLMPRAGGVPGWTNGGTAAPLLGFDAIIVDEAAQVLPWCRRFAV